MSPAAAATMGDDNDAEQQVMQTHHFDSTRWQRIAIRPDDVLVGTYPKSGTTWMQQIVRELLVIPKEGSLQDVGPWVDLRVKPLDALVERLEAQRHRRLLKHHLARQYLPADARRDAAHVAVCRDGRDVIMSLYSFWRAFTPAFMVKLQLETPPGIAPLPTADADVVTFFRHWLANDGAPWWSFWEHIRSWWAARNEPNVLLAHYAALKRDATREVARVQRFLARHGEVRMDDDAVARAVRNADFKVMKENGASIMPGMHRILEGGADKFFNQGTNGRWRGVLPDELVQEYEQTARRELGDECAKWLATGELPADCVE